jgi:hypothetical protein
VFRTACVTIPVAVVVTITIMVAATITVVVTVFDPDGMRRMPCFVVVAGAEERGANE